MYAHRMSLSHGPRPIPFAASLAVSSAIVAALVFVSPEAVEHITHPPTIVDTIPIPADPLPVDEVKPQPEKPRETTIVTPETPFKPLDPQPLMDTTTKIDPGPPPTLPGTSEGLGSTVVEPVPPPLPPLRKAEFDPRYARDLQPRYPNAELRLGNEGTATVRVLIGTDGRVKEVVKLSATSDAFFEATRQQALGRWRFKPATRGGVPEESWKQMTVRFEIPA